MLQLRQKRSLCKRMQTKVSGFHSVITHFIEDDQDLQGVIDIREADLEIGATRAEEVDLDLAQDQTEETEGIEEIEEAEETEETEMIEAREETATEATKTTTGKIEMVGDTERETILMRGQDLEETLWKRVLETEVREGRMILIEVLVTDTDLLAEAQILKEIIGVEAAPWHDLKDHKDLREDQKEGLMMVGKLIIISNAKRSRTEIDPATAQERALHRESSKSLLLSKIRVQIKRLSERS